MRNETRTFFLETYGFSPVDYFENENALVLLIHMTKSQQQVRELTSKRSNVVKKFFQETFGQKPNHKNLRAFFSSSIV